MSGPEIANGYQWFQVRQGPNGAAGWIASGTQDGPWLARVANGRLAATVSTDAEEGRLVTIAPDGADPRVITEGTAERSFSAAWPLWSPDGSELLAIRAGPPAQHAVYRIPADGGDLVPIGSGGRDAAWSPDGSLVAMGVPGGIELVGGSGESHIIELPLDSPFSIGWSPDGSALVFAAADPDPQTDEPWRLFTVPVGGGDPKPITGQGYYYTAGWSPDGSRIAYIEFTLSAEPPPGLHLVDADGGHDVKLSDLHTYDDSGHSAWSPDGSLLVAVKEREIAVIDPLEGSTRTVATLPGGWRGLSARWAPDGRALAVVSGNDPGGNAPLEYQLSVANADGGGMQPILDGARRVDWGPAEAPPRSATSPRDKCSTGAARKRARAPTAADRQVSRAPSTTPLLS
jgi:Tol biopolymer transport system component